MTYIIKPSDVYKSENKVKVLRLLETFTIKDFRPPLTGELFLHNSNLQPYTALTSYHWTCPRFIIEEPTIVAKDIWE